MAAPNAQAMHPRVNYDRSTLEEGSVAADPFTQFATWFETLRAEGEMREPHAMALATAASDGRPSLRIVLLRGYDARGFVFFTNYRSRKGHELDENPHAALLFYWEHLERQVRIEGRVARIDAAESDTYFAHRPRGHRLSAWASDQSTHIPDRAFVEKRMAEADARFGAGEVPRPDYWGGFRLTPSTFEFWQGRPNRVHDRIIYERESEEWRISRLSP